MKNIYMILLLGMSGVGACAMNNNNEPPRIPPFPWRFDRNGAFDANGERMPIAQRAFGNLTEQHMRELAGRLDRAAAVVVRRQDNCPPRNR